ncbi:hypothetical protein FA95DRAFT_804719 [Auriscalpium vulgare]|uniref:Uncharacterized protein n=1 Tax=Auriscalpium vulgare TaxID=40419 RepID=A0ACB8RAL9_9AGAM|nr:hypothetical protein FA95DRAFT_804719 [Auriscalpium vulgare]
MEEVDAGGWTYTDSRRRGPRPATPDDLPRCALPPPVCPHTRALALQHLSTPSQSASASQSTPPYIHSACASTRRTRVCAQLLCINTASLSAAVGVLDLAPAHSHAHRAHAFSPPTRPSPPSQCSMNMLDPAYQLPGTCSLPSQIVHRTAHAQRLCARARARTTAAPRITTPRVARVVTTASSPHRLPSSPRCALARRYLQRVASAHARRSACGHRPWSLRAPAAPRSIFPTAMPLRSAHDADASPATLASILRAARFQPTIRRWWCRARHARDTRDTRVWCWLRRAWRAGCCRAGSNGP